MDLALNNQQRLICHKTQQTNKTVYKYILDIYDLAWFEFYGILTIVGYLMPYPFFINILNIYDL